MSPEAQRIAIAEACGWTFLATRDNLVNGNSDLYSAPVGFRPDALKYYPGEGASAGYGSGGPIVELPNYLNDLNAMHEAEKVLTIRQSDLFFNYVGLSTGFKRMLHATATQRAEAFLHALCKWEDDK